MSSWWSFKSSSLSVALSSVADSLPDCSAEVTFSSTLSSEGPSASIEEDEDVDEGASGFSRLTADGGSVLSLAPNVPSGEASFCFWSCSFCRLRCFLRNFARRFLNHTWSFKKSVIFLKPGMLFWWNGDGLNEVSPGLVLRAGWCTWPDAHASLHQGSVSSERFSPELQAAARWRPCDSAAAYDAESRNEPRG